MLIKMFQRASRIDSTRSSDQKHIVTNAQSTYFQKAKLFSISDVLEGITKHLVIGTSGIGNALPRKRASAVIEQMGAERNGRKLRSQVS